MIMWHIKSKDEEFEIEVGQLTVLKGLKNEWFKVSRLITEFFENRKSDVEIYEGTQIINKTDWDFIFIPFDAHLEINKVTTKSPLKPMLDKIGEELSNQPSFLAFQEIWEEIVTERNYINEKLNDYGLRLDIRQFDPADFKHFLTLAPLEKWVTPLSYKKMLLKLFENNGVDKRKLVIIEMPEIYASKNEFSEFVSYVKGLQEKGIMFIVITGENISGNLNKVFSDRIVNEALINLVKKKVVNDLPFVYSEDLFLKAKNEILLPVDNYKYNENYLIEKEMIGVIKFLILYNLGIKSDVDMSGLSDNMRAFINDYL